MMTNDKPLARIKPGQQKIEAGDTYRLEHFFKPDQGAA
jgi:hypothetical protein